MSSWRRVAACVLGAMCLSTSAAANEVSDEGAPRAATKRAGMAEELLDEHRVVALALADHPTVQAAIEAHRSARAAGTAAQLDRAPDLHITGRYARLSSIPERFRNFDGLVFPQLLDNLGLRAQLTIPLSDTFFGLAAAARAAGREADARAIEIVAAKAQIAYEARGAFLEYWGRLLSLHSAEELVRAAESNARDQRARVAAGTAAPNDVLEFETALDAAEMGRQSAEADRIAAEAALRTFFPGLAGKQLRVAEQLPDLDSVPAARAQAPKVPPQIASLEARVRAAESRVDVESWGRLPKLSAYAVGDVSAPSPRVFVLTRLVAIPTWELGAQLEWSLSQLTSGTARRAQARAEHRMLQAQLEAAKRRLTGERNAALGVLRITGERVQRAQVRVEHAAALAQARRGELEVGSTSPLNVVLAESELARARHEHAAALVARSMARAKLDFVDGRTEVGVGGAR